VVDGNPTTFEGSSAVYSSGLKENGRKQTLYRKEKQNSFEAVDSVKYPQSSNPFQTVLS